MLRSRVPSAYLTRTMVAATPVKECWLLASRRFAGSHKSMPAGTSKFVADFEEKVLFHPAFQKEVKWNRFPRDPIDVAPVAGDLLKYVQRHGAAFVLGSPGCGKSSLMQYIIQTEAYKNYGFDR